MPPSHSFFLATDPIPVLDVIRLVLAPKSRELGGGCSEAGESLRGSGPQTPLDSFSSLWAPSFSFYCLVRQTAQLSRIPNHSPPTRVRKSLSPFFSLSYACLKIRFILPFLSLSIPFSFLSLSVFKDLPSYPLVHRVPIVLRHLAPGTYSLRIGGMRLVAVFA